MSPRPAALPLPRLLFGALFLLSGICASGQNTSPFQAFIYVEPFELRREFVVPLVGLSEWRERATESIATADREALLDSLRSLLDDACDIRMDGTERTFELSRIRFVQRKPGGGLEPDERAEIPVSEAVVGAVYSTATENYPQQLDVEWHLFPDQSKKAVAVTLEAWASGSMDSTTATLEFTPDQTTASWDAPDFLQAPALLEIPEIDAAGNPWIAGSLVAAGLFLLALARAFRGQRTRVIGFSAAGLIALALAAAGPLGLPPFPRATAVPATETEARLVVEPLLKNIYHAFDFRDESSIYDVLARSVAGDTLKDLYFDIRRRLTLEQEADGPRTRVLRVELDECRPFPGANSSGFTADTTWTASGNVSHWGHSHPRRNRYRGRLTLEPSEGRWKVSRVQILEEERR